MANYDCLAASDEHQRLFPFKVRGRTIRCDDGPCHSKLPCTLKDAGCLYFDQYRKALASRTVLTNYDYWISSRRYSKGLGVVDRLVCDEAHDCADKLMGACRIEISLSDVDGPTPRTLSQWRQWASAKLDAIKRESQDQDARVRKRRQIERLEGLLAVDGSWAWELQGDRAVFEPSVPRHLTRLLYDAQTTVVYLSATVTAASVSSLLNIPRDDVTFLGLPSRFPVERRPIHLVRTCRVDYRWTKDDEAFWLRRIDQILDLCAGRKGIIHTVSYSRQQLILAASKHSGMMLAPRRASEVADAVERFKRSPRPLVLVSPSVDTGFDFPMDQCEFQIICKVPFPDTRSPIMKARIKATPGYRDIHTAQKLVQMAGRGMRAENDSCTTFCIDDNALWFIDKNRDYFPQDFLDAVVPTRRLPPPRPKL
jgi:Rad3-related DNA helicase